MEFLEGVRVFCPDEGEPKLQISMDCLELVFDILRQSIHSAVIEAVEEAIQEAVEATADSVERDTAREVLQMVEDVAATGQLDSVEEVCNFLRAYLSL